MPKVMRDWTDELTIRQGAVLTSAIRGCDGAPKHDVSKSVLWALRWVVLNPSEEGVDPYQTESFMGYTPTLGQDWQKFVKSLDHYPLHFVTHIMHAAEIIGYKHPDEDVRVLWLTIYRRMVDAFHLNPETKNEMEFRLRDY